MGVMAGGGGAPVGRGAPASSPGCSRRALLGAARGGERRRREKEEREEEKKKREKGKRKKKKRKEREGKRELPARFVAAVGHARAASLGRSTTCTQNEKKRDGTGIGTGVGTADCRDMISGDWEFGRKMILNRFELYHEKDFEIYF